MSKDELGDRMKDAESVYDLQIPGDKFIVLRADGRSFSKFTSDFAKPFDPRMSSAMLAAAIEMNDTMLGFMGYVQSDEITVVLKPKRNKADTGFIDHIFNGRIQKLISLAASSATRAFNENIGTYSNKRPLFDCRIQAFDTIDEATNCVFWRILDCKRNAVSAVYRYTYGHSKMQNKSVKVMLEELVSDGHWAKYHNDYKYGVLFSKKKSSLIEGRVIDTRINLEEVLEKHSHECRVKAFLEE